MIKTKDIREGKLNGSVVWICDYRHNDYSKKPIRHIRPTQVLVRSNSETRKNIYYSSSHFVGLNKKGEPIESKVIALFDNTGFRSRTGTAMNAFLTEQECQTHYDNQVNIVKRGLDNYKKSLQEKIDKL